MERKRIRDFGIVPGVMKTGPKNKITDVPGVLVGHKTVRNGDNKTGVTVIVPGPGNVFERKFIAAGYVHNGFGKTCGPDGDIIIFSFDAVKAAFDAMIAGDLNAAFECNPLHGPRVDEIIKKLEKGETVEKIQYVDEAYFDTSMDLESIKAERAY